MAPKTDEFDLVVIGGGPAGAAAEQAWNDRLAAYAQAFPDEAAALTRRLAREQQIGVLFTEHSMDVVFAHADRMIVLARGRLIAEGAPLDIRDHPKVQEVYFGSGKTFERLSAEVAGGKA